MQDVNLYIVLMMSSKAWLLPSFPDNRNRVKLAFIYGQKGSDYINASYVDVCIS